MDTLASDYLTEEVQKWIDTTTVNIMYNLQKGCAETMGALCEMVGKMLNAERWRLGWSGRRYLMQTPINPPREVNNASQFWPLLFHIMLNLALKANTEWKEDDVIMQRYGIDPKILIEIEMHLLKACHFKIFDGCLED
jgi:hypothetical protein